MTGDPFFDSPGQFVQAPPAHVGLVYTGRPTGGSYLVAYPDREVVTDRRERAICKALLLHALKLIEEAEARDE